MKNNKKEIIDAIYNMRVLIYDCPELFHDGIDDEIIKLLNEILKFLKSEDE